MYVTPPCLFMLVLSLILIQVDVKQFTFANHFNTVKYLQYLLTVFEVRKPVFMVEIILVLHSLF